MRKSFITIIIISISAIASLMTAMFLMPLRTSFTQYISRYSNEVLVSSGVDFIALNNVRLSSKAGRYTLNNFSIPDPTNEKNKASKTRVYSKIFGFNYDGSYSALANLSRNEANGSIGASGAVSLGVSGGKSATNNSGAQNGIRTLSTDLTVNGSGTTRKGVNYATNKGGAHPGLDPVGAILPQKDPGVPSLPIGDGISCLLILAIIFGGWKIKKTLVAQ